jgi:hypothetical protein
MNSKDISNSIPNTIQNYDNYLKDYVNTSGFQWNSSCLDVAFTNLGDNFINYVQKIGDYNTVTATNPKYIPSYTEPDYSGNCPDGWTTNPIWNWGDQKYAGCTNPNYTNPTNTFNQGPCYAGRTQQTPQAASCPTKFVGDPSSYTNSYQRWNWWYPGEVTDYYTTPNNNSYTGWDGPTDASQGDFSNTNIGSQPSGAGSFCTAGWAEGNSQGGSWTDCAISGGTWVNYYNDPNFGSHGYTCFKPTQYKWTTEPASYFWTGDYDDKRNWANTCNAPWPMKTIPPRWTCTYGGNIDDDIANTRIIKLPGTASSIGEAAKIALKSNRMIDNYFFMIDNNIYITGANSDINVFTSKQPYQPNCTENNNKMGTLYVITQQFFDMLNNCKVVNDKINDTNTARTVLQSAIVGSIKENFTNLDIIKDITKNQDEIIKNLASNYNKKAELYNYQIDLIGQNEALVETQNKKLNKQLDEMTAIQEQIALKDRVIDLNDELAKKQIRNKKILIGFFVLIPFLGIALLLVVTKAFSPFIGLGLGGLMIIGYIIYILVVANMTEIKNFGREEKKTISKYAKAISSYWNKEKEALSKSLSKFVNENCADNNRPNGSQEEEEESGSGSNRPVAYPKGDYLMKSNGPFYYYDGSAPPQQIYPGAMGSINFSIEEEIQQFPNIDLKKIKNPITKFFFQTWLSILNQNGIKMDDPRFNEVLDVIDFPDSDQTPMPFWDNIKLPIVTNVDQQFNYLFQSYNKEKKNLSKTASVLLVDLWNFVFGDKIPGDVYETWVKKLANILKETEPNIEGFYKNYLDYIRSLPKFTEKYGSGSPGLLKFIELKMVDFIKTFNQDINVSQPFAKRYVP